MMDVKPQVEFTPDRKLYFAIASLSALALVAALGSTSLSIALPTIADQLQLSTTQAFWLGLSSTLAATVLQPSCACIADCVGRKVALAGSVTCLAAGSLTAALAQDFTVLIAGRTFLGLGIGGVIALSEIIVTDIVPLRFRGQYLAFVSISWAIGTVVGPVIGGGLANGSSWRWIFGMNIPISAVALVICQLTLSSVKISNFPLLQRLGHIDWIGFILFTASLIGILIPIMQANVVYPWADWRTIVPICVSGFGMTCFCIYEYALAKNPLIPFIIFKNRSAAITYISTILHGLVLWCLLYYLPLYYEAVKDMSPINAGLAVLPETLTLVPASVITGLCITRTGSYRWAIWLGWVITTIGMGLLMLLDVDTSTAGWVGLNLIVGMGTGMLFGAMAFAVQASVHIDSIAVAVCVFSFFRSFGSTIGITIGGTVFQNRIRQLLEQHPQFASAGINFVDDSIALVAAIKTLPEDGGRSILMQAYAKALQTIWQDMCILSAIGLLLSLFIQSYTLDVPLRKDQHTSTDQVDDLEQTAQRKPEVASFISS